MATLEGPSPLYASSSSSSSSYSAPSSPNPLAKKGLTFDDLAKYFHLPITQVSKELGICATVLKKICRRNGIHRWPHRKIKSIDRMVEMLESSLDGRNTEEQLRLRREIDTMKRKKTNLLKNPHSLESTQRLVYNIPSKMIKKPGSPPPVLRKQQEPYTPTTFDLRNLPAAFNFSGIPRAPSPTEQDKVTKEKLQETLSSILQRSEKDGKVLQQPSILKNIIERLSEDPSSMSIDSESSDSMISEIASTMQNAKIQQDTPSKPPTRVVASTVTSSASTSFTNKFPDGSSNSVTFASLLQKQEKSKQNDSLITQALNNQLIKNFVKFQPTVVAPSEVATKDLPLERPVVVTATVLPDPDSNMLPSLRSWHNEESQFKDVIPLQVEIPKIQVTGPKIPILEPDPTKYSLQKAKPVTKPAEHATSSS